MSEPTVSVIMTARNAEGYVAAAVRSVLEQDLRDIELIVVDDGSTDKSPEILEQLTDDERLIVLRREYRGIPAALNEALSYCRAPFIARQDADDLSKPGRLATQVKFMLQDRNCGIVGTAADVIDASGRHLYQMMLPLRPDQIREDLLIRNCMVHGSVMMRREIINQLGGYRAEFQYAQDYDLWLRALEITHLANIASALYQYRLTDTSVSGQHRSMQLHFQELARQDAQERMLCRGPVETLAMQRYQAAGA